MVILDIFREQKTVLSWRGGKRRWGVVVVRKNKTRKWVQGQVVHLEVNIKGSISVPFPDSFPG